jgi:hypothetical protein
MLNFLISYVIVKFLYDIFVDYRCWKNEKEQSQRKVIYDSEDYFHYLEILDRELNLKGIRYEHED